MVAGRVPVVGTDGDRVVGDVHNGRRVVLPLLSTIGIDIAAKLRVVCLLKVFGIQRAAEYAFCIGYVFVGGYMRAANDNL